MRLHQLDINPILQPGRNQLRTKVANPLINRVLGGGPIDYSQVIPQYGERFPGATSGS